jgi:hypothetical protein
MRFAMTWTCTAALSLLFISTQQARCAGLTDKECTDFAKSIESLANSRNEAGLRALTSWDAFADKACQGIPLATDDKKAVKSILAEQAPFEKPLCDAVATGAHYHLLRIRSEGESKRALFRLRAMGKGVSYHEIELSRAARGEIRIVDVYYYLTGEWLSETMHRDVIRLLNDRLIAPRSGLSGQDSMLARSWPICVKIRDALSDKQYQIAMERYHELPEEMQHSNIGLAFRLQAARPLGEAETTAAFEAFRKYQPNNPAVDFYAIDYHLARKEYADARSAIDHLNIRLGGEPYLLARVASVYLLEGNVELATANAQRAIDAESTLDEGYFAMIAIELKQKDFAKVRVSLEQLESRTQTRAYPHKLQRNPLYADFVKSDEFTQWVGNRSAANSVPTKDTTSKAVGGTP